MVMNIDCYSSVEPIKNKLITKKYLKPLDHIDSVSPPTRRAPYYESEVTLSMCDS